MLNIFQPSRIAFVALLLALLSTPPAIGMAAQSPATETVQKISAELIVFETDRCPYCHIFRRDVAPSYLQSPRAKQVPMRFVNVHRSDISHLGLKEPLTMVPTVIFMQNGREVDRITGYRGPEPFFHMVSRLMRN